jgi:copper chaperone
MPMSDERRSYKVTGMTCQHCVAAVDAEVGALPGVSSVDVDLASGALVVSGSDIDGDAVRGAVEEAGYSLAS